MLTNERGSAIIKTPLAVGAVALVLTGLTTGVQVAWTDLALSSSLGATTRFASNVSYSAGTAAARRNTQDQVRQWAADVAAESHVQPDDIVVVATRPPAGTPVPLDQLVVGDEVTLTVRKTVSNPLFRMVSVVANAVTNAVGADDVLDPDGIDVTAHATNHVG